MGCAGIRSLRTLMEGDPENLPILRLSSYYLGGRSDQSGDCQRENIGGTELSTVRGPASRLNVSQFAGRRFRLRYRHFHAERWRGMADAFTGRRPRICRAYVNCSFAALLSTGASRWFCRGYLLP